MSICTSDPVRAHGRRLARRALAAALLLGCAALLFAAWRLAGVFFASLRFFPASGLL